tara:strand:- start:351 stop:476 length:126 start_codon:yes stop_codon:yes gene_type:complete
MVYIDILWEPITVLGGVLITYFIFSWFLEKVGDILGIKDED